MPGLVSNKEKLAAMGWIVHPWYTDKFIDGAVESLERIGKKAEQAMIDYLERECYG